MYTPEAEHKKAITVIDGLAVCHEHIHAATDGKGDFLDKLSAILEP
jgi:hypothetical protein